VPAVSVPPQSQLLALEKIIHADGRIIVAEDHENLRVILTQIVAQDLPARGEIVAGKDVGTAQHGVGKEIPSEKYGRRPLGGGRRP